MASRLPLDEKGLRRPGWTEGEWITLADGQAWSFPDPAAVPGHNELAADAARELSDQMIPLMNIDAIAKQGERALASDPGDMFRSIGRALAVYRIAFRAGSNLLRRNYAIGDEECERLMPFNYQLSDLADPTSKVHMATPAELAIANAVAKACGVDWESDFARIAGSN